MRIVFLYLTDRSRNEFLFAKYVSMSTATLRLGQANLSIVSRVCVPVYEYMCVWVYVLQVAYKSAEWKILSSISEGGLKDACSFISKCRLKDLAIISEHLYREYKYA